MSEHDSREAVDGIREWLFRCAHVDRVSGHEAGAESHEEAAAMLLRLLARAEAAEQERTMAWSAAEQLRQSRDEAKAALATARSAALREAAAVADERHRKRAAAKRAARLKRDGLRATVSMQHASASEEAMLIKSAILALINKGKPAEKKPAEEESEPIYRHPEGWIDGDFE